MAMERSLSSHDDIHDEDDRRSRFQNTTGPENGGSSSLRERAASQPPRSSDSSTFVSSPPTQHFVPSSVGGPWSNNNNNNASRMLSPNRGQPVPIRSSSFSSHPQNQLLSTMRDRVFPSTFEDDESEALSDTYDERYVPPSLSNPRGRNYGQDPTRSRSQSLATGRPGPVGSLFGGSGSSAMQSWNESYLSSHTNPLSIPSGGQRYGEIKPPGGSRYGSLGTMGRSPTSPTNTLGGNGYGSRNQQVDISNMSPFVRDVGQILLDDGSAFRELWAGMNPPRDENGGGGSGTTSRRHSVSVVQPRRGNVVGFNAPGADNMDEIHIPRTSFPQQGYGGRSGLLLSDDDLASDLGLLNINPNEAPPPSTSTAIHPPSQPSSLPIYAPLSRSPPSRDLMSTYQSINLSIPAGGNGNNYSRQPIGTPSDGDFSGSGNSPIQQTRGVFEEHAGQGQGQSQYNTQTGRGGGQQEMMARFIPGQGIQYVHPQQHHLQQQQLLHMHQQQQQQQQQIQHVPNFNPQYARARAPSYSGGGNLHSPISPTGTRGIINPQQGPYYPQTQRRPSDAQHHQPPTPTHPHGHGHGHGHSHSQQHGHGGHGGQQQQQQGNLADLGKGVPLHAVPASWPLFIVEFKAGRTDLFYLTDMSQDIRIGDLVIVEADRGKDLGKVVNDSITLAEVEAWQRQVAEKGIGGGGGGMGDEGDVVSPGGSGAAGGKKEISPKMMYKKAGAQDMQLLATKTEDEAKALQLCQSKVRAKKLPMEVIDAEYQWDRRKLTFYFVADKRIDFRELVRELFRLYKTRIWMASLQGGGGYEQ